MHSWLKCLIIWFVWFIACTGVLLFFITFLPEDDETGSIISKLPTNFSQLKKFHTTLISYTEKHRFIVIFTFAITYIYKQMFSIPGSVLLNLIAGVIFDITFAYPLCCVLCTIGASCAYWQSHFLGKEIIEYWMPKKLQDLQGRVASQEMGLLTYLIVIRLFPFTPNWFINLASPIISIPYPLFLISVFIGLLPYNYVTTQAGNIVNELNSTKDVFSLSIVIKLILCCFVVLAIPIAKSYIAPKLQVFSKPLNMYYYF